MERMGTHEIFTGDFFFQFIAAADLEPEKERTKAVDYHKAWQNLCSAE